MLQNFGEASRWSSSSASQRHSTLAIANSKASGLCPSKSIVLDNNNHIYVNQGAYSNSCQEVDRTKGSKGKMPCPVLNDAAGIWQYSADKLNQGRHRRLTPSGAPCMTHHRTSQIVAE